jgi:hypothetical protein
MQYKIHVLTNQKKKFVCEGRISLTEYGVARALDKSGKEVIGHLVFANVEQINDTGILISGFEEFIQNPFERPKYRYKEWLLKYIQEGEGYEIQELLLECSQERERYEIYAQEPEPKQICLGKCNFTRDGQAFAIDKNKSVVAELTRARVNFMGADGIMVSGFEKIIKDNRKKPNYRYQEWWLRYI